MANSPGDFIWYELMCRDADASARFYEGLLGWSVEGQADYREIKAPDGEYVGGILPLSHEMLAGGAMPAWLGYILVADVDQTVTALLDAGGSVLMPARDMESVGRMAMVADPQGAPFYVMTPAPPADRPDAESTAFAKYAPQIGHCAWNELLTADPAAADEFYRGLFGWTKGEALEMGPMGTYQMYNHGDYGLGAMMRKPAEVPVSSWAYYFRVPEIDAAVAYVSANGGQIAVGPMAIPGGDHVLQGFDPQGALFSLIGSKEA
ncbi:VOC family protein [Erythrobacter sp. SDW2]|uniref:VOC family protein n=1 Tax=Erythrobacter sp. SDW2 TaxID=2907154 RepID=UPI001F3798BC|nr:VOC family protein [Erythrobacter sp. SDW2]UIP06319.1 VOC family protein [Erythrobacter sp. SDW2]